MNNSRPDPDELLAQVKAKEADERRGSLKVFFGYAAGVGKTFSMLENAQRAKSDGRDVVVGYIEPHDRPETAALLAGLETIPVREYQYRGVTLRDFDVDAALARNPELILVDELAHTNAAGCRHEKRWQDVEELLDAGINVWTTLNVQHIESLNDVIGQITGVNIRETVPDRVFERADDLELVDITPEELLKRLNAGKVYVSDQARRALLGFFQKSNLSALRELSLRQAALRVHSDVESARKEKAAVHPWATSERLLACVGPSPTTARVIRTARRMAVALDAPWIALSVDLTGEPSSNPRQQNISRHFRLAERLGAETVTVAGQNVADAVLDFARSRNVTGILVGKTNQPRWRRLLFGTVVDELLEKSDYIDVCVIQGEEEDIGHATDRAEKSAVAKLPYLWATGWVGLAGIIAYALRRWHIADAEADTVLLFLAAVGWTSFRYSRGPAIYASVLAVLVFDFFFVPPYLTLAVRDAQYLVTFIVMLVIGLVISTLTSRLRSQVESTRRRERRTSSLLELGKQLCSLYGDVFLASAAGGRVAEMIGGEVAIYLKQPNGGAEPVYGQDSAIVRHSVSLPVAQWVIGHDQMAGAGTNTLPNAIALFLPLTGSQQTYGAIAVRAPIPERLLDPEVRRLLEACANQLALALERDHLAIEAADARIQAEAEQVRSSLLSSVSHDLRTPLAAVAGASSSLLEAASLDEPTRRQLLETVADETARLNRLLENILQMSKLEAGAAAPSRQWHVLEELVGSALHRARRELSHHEVSVQLRGDLPLLHVDGLLMEQVFVNLLENAARHTPAGTEVTIQAAADGEHVRIAVSDKGPGLPAGAEERIFDKFYRASQTSDSGRGSGLGLAICRAIVQAHSGTITAANRPGGGAEFVIRLPIAKDAPHVALE